MADVEFVSIIRIIQEPAAFDGKLVRVVAYGDFDFESKGVYVSPADRDHSITKNALWVETELTDKVKMLHGQCVLVEGTFDAGSQGHLGMYSGTIKDVTRLVQWVPNN